MNTVAFQGEPGAYGEAAALSFFGSTCAPQPKYAFEDVFAAVVDSSVDFGIVPIENSLAGSIHRNYDLLVRHNLHIIGEAIVRVSHNLITFPGVQLGDIKRVISHPQALAQCEMSITRLMPSAEREQVYDTAGSVKILKESGRRDTGALASTRAAELYGLPILRPAMEDDPTNYTRFVALAREVDKAAPNPDAIYKTSLVCAVNNVPGSLFRTLGALAMRDIDLCKIESRPLQGSPWEYLFYIDIVGHKDDPKMQRALANLQEYTTIYRLLGSYPRAAMPV